jgi:hypothetical protein
MCGLRRVLAVVIPVALFSLDGFGAEPASKSQAEKHKPFNLEKRELWTAGNIHGTPDRKSVV